MVWALVADTVPLYPLYALFFSDTGLTDGQISVLFALWSLTSFLTEVPAGVLADRVSRRGAVIGSALLQGCGYAVWTVRPSFTGFAVGFVLWGVAISLASGSVEALVYDALEATGSSDRFTSVWGRISAAGLISQVPAAVAAVALFSLGGYSAVGWASVAVCGAAACCAARLPDALPDTAHLDQGRDDSWRSVLRASAALILARPVLRLGALGVAAVNGVDAVDEYFPLVVRDLGVSVGAIPVVALAIPAAGAVGAYAGGRASGWSRRLCAIVLLISAIVLAAGAQGGAVLGLTAVSAFYGLYRLVLVVADARLQTVIDSDVRATVTSVVELGVELSALGIYLAWSLGGVRGIAVATVIAAGAVATTLPRVDAE